MEKKLIESALWLCEYMYSDFMDEIYRWDSYSFSWEYSWPNIELKFSIEKLCYYLLSPEFIEKYRYVIADFYDFDKTHLSIERFAKAIWYYQSWNEEPLISLLSKIK